MAELSILTITRNNREGLERTIASVASQTIRPFEFIVHDGDSTDGTQALLAGQGCVTKWDSAKDDGIADALNRTASQASGDWLLFLNAGDTLADPRVLEDLIPQLDSIPADVGFCFGNAMLVDPDGTELGIQIGRHVDGHGHNTICHQAAFIRRGVQIATPYDKRLRIGMDYDLWYRLEKQVGFAKLDRTVCRYALGGLSSSKPWAEHSIVAHHMIDWMNLSGRKLDLSDVLRLLAAIVGLRAKKLFERLCGPYVYGMLRKRRKR